VKGKAWGGEKKEMDRMVFTPKRKTSAQIGVSASFSHGEATPSGESESPEMIQTKLRKGGDNWTAVSHR